LSIDLDREFTGFSLRESGFEKYTCRKCGARFWSIKPRDTCPDRPCSRYDFLYKNYPGLNQLSLSEARRRFIDFFIRNGHGYIDPYPVIAKWRDDLYLTIASIIVFQPLVTNGLVDPPYNPLVIVQPCIRLEDIDNVGLTFGRHLTSFEMGGHHAFNKDDRYVYWMSETVEYAIRFFNEEIGVPLEDIVLKESWWEGGGNAGPAFEVLIDGLELATLVFMKYKVVNGNYVKNPVLVVDTGYGIERIAWFTQRKPTAFHAIFGDLVKTYRDIIGVEEPSIDVLKKIVYLTSDSEVESLDDLGKILVENDLNEYVDQTIQSIHLYTLLDHGKTILLLLSNGIVPSNTGEGYLARLVIRRMLKTLMRLGFEISRLNDVMLELLEKQADYWRGEYVYRVFNEKMDYVRDVISIETSKFIDNITRGVRVVDKYISKGRVSIDDLVEIYDSHGVPPEIVVERASKYGLKIEVPKNFYSYIVRKHGVSTGIGKVTGEKYPEDVVEWALKHEVTELVFHREPYRRSFHARLIGVKDRYVVFDKTIFYPKAGGQDHDTGYIVWNGRRYNVVNVFKIGDVIIHELDNTPDIPVDSIVEQVVDWSRRYRLMRHHTATHIVLGAARRVLGDHVWQAGVEKTVEKARLDITHYKMLSDEEIKAIEIEANKIIDQRIPLKFHYLSKFDAERKYGVRIYQGGPVYSKILRIVEIPGVDAEACYGVHVENTGEVGGIKIINVEKIQDGVIRLEFTAATRLPEYIGLIEDSHRKTLMILGVQTGDLTSVVEKKMREFRELEDLVKDYRRILRERILSEARSRYIDLCGVKTFVLTSEISDQQLYRSLIEELVFKDKYLVVYVDRDLVEIAVDPEQARERSIDLRKVIPALNNRGVDVKGGGKPDHVTLKTSNPKAVIDVIIECLREIT